LTYPDIAIRPLSFSGLFYCRCLEIHQEHGVQNLPTFYNTKDVQQLMRCCRSTVNNHIRKNSDFPKPRKFGRNLLWPAADFNAWLARRYGVQP
jgi:predicted DNA-binding transcriptional regulator AlpA